MPQEPTEVATQVRDAVLGKIEEGHIAMRPRTYFILKGALTGLGLGIVALGAMLTVSMVAWSLRASGAWALPRFGMRGWGVFMEGAPWLLLVLAVGFIVVLEILVRRYGVAWRRPLLASALVIAVLAVAAGVAADRIGVHQRFLRRAEFFGAPPFPDASGISIPGRGMRSGMFGRGLPLVGIVRDAGQDGFTLALPNGDTLSVSVSAETRYPFGPAADGAVVAVIGERDGMRVIARGVKRLADSAEQLPVPIPSLRPGGGLRGRNMAPR